MTGKCLGSGRAALPRRPNNGRSSSSALPRPIFMVCGAACGMWTDLKMVFGHGLTRMKHGLGRSAEFIPHSLTTDTEGGMNSALRAATGCQSRFHSSWRPAVA